MSNVKIFAPSDRLDSGNAAAFEQEVLAAIAGGSNRVLMDFSGLSYISSAGLRVVLLTAKKTKAAGGRLALCSLNDSIREVFVVSGFDNILDIQPDQSAGLARLQ
jgi:anti-anti-sigma factor